MSSRFTNLGKIIPKSDICEPSENFLKLQEYFENAEKLLAKPFVEIDQPFIKVLSSDLTPKLFELFKTKKQLNNTVLFMTVYSVIYKFVVPKKPRGIGSKSKNQNIEKQTLNQFDSYFDEIKPAVDSLHKKSIKALEIFHVIEDTSDTSWFHSWIKRMISMSFDHLHEAKLLLDFQIHHDKTFNRKSGDIYKKFLRIYNEKLLVKILKATYSDIKSLEPSIGSKDYDRVYKGINRSIAEFGRTSASKTHAISPKYKKLR